MYFYYIICKYFIKDDTLHNLGNFSNLLKNSNQIVIIEIRYIEVIKMIDFRKEFKTVLWSDFERGDIDEYTMQRYFQLMDGKDNKYIQGLYDSYHVLMLNRLSL